MHMLMMMLVAVLAASCAESDSRPERSDRPAGDPATGLDTVTDNGESDDRAATSPVERIYNYGMSFGESRSEIEEALGTPLSADTTLEQNRHVRDATDSLFVFRYAGLTFTLNRPGPVDGELLTSVSMTSADRELPGGVRIGTTTRDDLTSRLGTPESTRPRGDTTVLSYRPPGRAADRFVDFHLVGDTLRRVRWIPYVD